MTEIMPKEHEEHLLRILKHTIPELQQKYRKGYREHGDELWRMKTRDLARNLIEEGLDILVYGYTILEQLEDEESGIM